MDIGMDVKSHIHENPVKWDDYASTCLLFTCNLYAQRLCMYSVIAVKSDEIYPIFQTLLHPVRCVLIYAFSIVVKANIFLREVTLYVYL